MLKGVCLQLVLARFQAFVRRHSCFVENYLDDFLRANLVKDAITADHNEVKVVIDVHDVNLRLSDDTLGITSVLFHLGNTIPECP